MMRTIEILLVIIIITGAFIIASLFAILPSPRQVSPLNLRRLALTTLQTLDGDYDLSATVFKANDDSAWAQLQIALSACLPPNMVYNLTVYEVHGGAQLYTVINSISNAESLGVGSDAASSLLASSNVTFSVTPEKIGEHGGGGTLYILNCSDANGWWITGYTAQSLAEDLYKLLSPYFTATIMVQNTTQLGQLLNGTKISNSPYESVTNAVIINTFGESVPIPQIYCQGYALQAEGYASGVSYPYTRYCYTLGNKTRYYNWTWASIVGYPLYYVSNTVVFANQNNTYGIYGMQKVYQGGINAFLQGLDNNQPFAYNDGGITKSNSTQVNLLPNIIYYCNYYGIYPSSSHTSTRALSTSILSTGSNGYNLTLGLDMFSRFDSNYIPGAVYRHIFRGSTNVTGSLLALGLTRSPDIRLTALGILSYYQPRLYRSEYTANGTSRLVVLQLGLMGGV
ncbi:hypothetical protein MUO83_00015 [Candidatus Bathyarchaeota archaeon]|nr:hypothetical protein [Candidatus Bathyarchaeota archaeon]